MLFTVRPGGFEPPTFWSVARYSIQLSYGRINYVCLSWGVGTEPQPPGPEPGVLPLDDTPKTVKSIDNIQEIYKKGQNV